MNVAGTLAIPVRAQSTNDPGPFLDFLNRFFQHNEAPTDCPANQRDQNGRCIDLTNLAQRCLYEDKLNKNNQYDPACCRIDNQCPNNQRCNISNDWCKSGSSCNPNNSSQQPTTPPGQQPTTQPANPTSAPNPNADRATFSGNFKYFCQGDPQWQNSCGVDDLRKNGCCPTSVAMVAKTFGVDTDPKRMDEQVFRQITYRNGNGVDVPLRSCNQYCTFASDAYVGNKFFLESWLNQKGIGVHPDVVVWDASIQNSVFDCDLAKRYIQEGSLLMAYASGYPIRNASPTAHAFVIDEVVCNKNDRSKELVRVRDPSNCTAQNPNEIWEESFIYKNAHQLLDGKSGVFPVQKL